MELVKSAVADVAGGVLGTVVRKSPDWFMENETEINYLIAVKNRAYQATLGGRVTRSSYNILSRFGGPGSNRSRENTSAILYPSTRKPAASPQRNKG